MDLDRWSFLLVVLSLIGWAYLLLGRHRFWHAWPRLDRDAQAPPLADVPDVVAVIPARNEAAYVGRALRSLLDQDYPGRLCVVLVDDHSEDGTRAIAQALPAGPGRALEVIGARPLPAGWSGKLWAVSQGLEHAARHWPRARYVLLADADIAHDRANLRRLVARAERDALDLVSLMVRLHCAHLWERLLIPPFVFFFRKLYPFAAVNRAEDACAAAAGGCMLVRRDALMRAGGIEAIHDCLIDDVSLARRIKHHPLPHAGRIWLGLTDSTVSLRRQTRLDEIWAMVARSADSQLGHSLGLLALTVIGMPLLYLAPPVAVLSWPLHGQPGCALLGLTAWLGMALAYWPTVRLYGLAPHWSLTLPLAAVLYTAMTVDSALQYRRGTGGRWKGRIAEPVALLPQTPNQNAPMAPSTGMSPARNLLDSGALTNDDGRMLQDHKVGLSESGAPEWQSAGYSSPTRPDSIQEARRDLEALQQADGHWVFELEADATIPADYVFLEHFLDEIDQDLEDKIGAYLRAGQAEHGGWSLFVGGEFNLSASVRAYFALKLIGDDPAAPHMTRAREAILAHGGAARTNVFTRIHLALFGQVPWRAVPVMPVELMLLPGWFPFHLDKVSYWSRVTIVPLALLMALKPRARNPRGIRIDELFVTPPEAERGYVTNPTGAVWGSVFLGVDRVLRLVEPHLPRAPRQRAIAKAVAFITERLNGEDGIGGIFPPMAATVMSFDALGYPSDHRDMLIAKQAIKKLLVESADTAYVQPCLSPVWDTALSCHALMESGASPDDEGLRRGLDWLVDRQITETVGDWARQRPDLRPGGWPFEYRNDYYPDVDDAAVVVCALHRADPDRYKESIRLGAEWVLGMQSRNGGWGSFDVDNTHAYLNNIPFADHGALLDPPTADLTARCISMLGELGYDQSHPAMVRGVAFLKAEQEDDGSWFGRWGTNYVYGTWSALCALNAAGEDMQAPYIRKAVDWLIARQHADGGWGESCASYAPELKDEPVVSTPTQTSWALLALMAAGEAGSEAVSRGVAHLEAVPRDGAKWQEELYNAVGFPRVFYLRYHGYSAFFPLWALARHANLMRRNDRTVPHGM